MTEVFLVTIKHDGEGYTSCDAKAGDWLCFRSTHNLEIATHTADSLREAGHDVKLQSVLLDADGKVNV